MSEGLTLARTNNTGRPHPVHDNDTNGAPPVRELLAKLANTVADGWARTPGIIKFCYVAAVLLTVQMGVLDRLAGGSGMEDFLTAVAIFIFGLAGLCGKYRMAD